MAKASLQTRKPKKSAPWWVYMVLTEKGKLYTGITTDLKRRWRQHRGELTGGAKYFRAAPALKMVFKEKQLTRSEALKREAQIKRLTRAQKLQLL